MSRHPYTNSCDFIRSIVGSEVSRSKASQLRTAIATEIGVEDKRLAELLSFAFCRNEQPQIDRDANGQKSALEQAKEDAAHFGVGYVAMYRDGHLERLDPRSIFLEPPEQYGTKT